MRKLAAVLVAALVAGALTASAMAGSPPIKTAKVLDDGMAFAPKKLAIKKGTKVVWKWVDGTDVTHDIAVVKGPVKFHSKLKSRGTFSHLFNRRGTYVLHCTIHPWMVERVIVK